MCCFLITFRRVYLKVCVFASFFWRQAKKTKVMRNDLLWSMTSKRPGDAVPCFRCAGTDLRMREGVTEMFPHLKNLTGHAVNWKLMTTFVLIYYKCIVAMKKQTNTDFAVVNAFDSFVFQTEELFEIKSDIKWINSKSNNKKNTYHWKCSRGRIMIRSVKIKCLYTGIRDNSSYWDVFFRQTPSN